MAEPSPEQDELIEHLKHYVWAGVPMAIIIVLTKALVARYPTIEVGWLLGAVAAPVIAAAYAFAFWWRKRRA
jgi:hypothetical protein